MLFRIVVVITVFLSFIASSPARAAKPNLSGTWQLNPDESDDPLEVMRDRLDKQPRKDLGVLPGGPARTPATPRRPSGSVAMRQPDEGVERLEIVHEEPRMSIRFADGRERVFFTDNRAPVDNFEIGLLAVSAKWKKRDLVFTAESAYGGRVRETYQLTADGARLTVIVRRDGDGRSPGIVFKRIYDRVEAWGTVSNGDEDAGP